MFGMEVGTWRREKSEEEKEEKVGVRTKRQTFHFHIQGFANWKQ